MRRLSVTGTTPDGRSLLLRADTELFELALEDVPGAARARPAVPVPLPGMGTPAPSPREIQQRIRHGASAADIADGSGLALQSVARYEGPVLAEREYHAQRARRAELDGRTVDDLVTEHFTRLGPVGADVLWDCWLTESGRWEVRARSGQDMVRLSWDATSRRVTPLDEAGRQALLLDPTPQNALEAVLRPLRRAAGPSAPPAPTPPAPPAPPGAADAPPGEDGADGVDGPLDAPAPAGPPRPARRAAGRRGRVEVPLWDDITTSVAGRRRPPSPGDEAR